MCDVFFLGTAFKMPSQISERKPGSCSEIDGNVIVDSRGNADLGVEVIDGDPKRTRDKPKLACCRINAIVVIMQVVMRVLL